MNKVLVLLKVKILRRTLILALVFIALGLRSVQALSSEFNEMLDIIGIPKYNVYNQPINEEIYMVYNLFVYSSPTTVNVNGQRWKNLASGKWQYGAGMYKGNGIRGEYEILGRDYSGTLVYNYFFPFDRVPTVSPEQWKYLTVSNAIASWQDKNKYTYIEQLKYMKTSNWYFADLNRWVDDPYNQIEYNINALKVGLNKVRLQNCATWKSSGTVYIRRLSESGKIGYATFMIPPMGAGVTLKSNIILNSEEYVLNEELDKIYIPIRVNAYLDNLNEYTKKEHIKNFNIKLYINSKEVLDNSGSKITSLGNEYMLVLTRQDFPQPQKYTIEIKLDSLVQTAFANDGLLKTSESKKISLIVEDKKIDVITSSDIRELLSLDNKWVVSPLAQNYETKLENSCGFTESGRYIVIKNVLNMQENIDINKISRLEIYLNDIKLNEYDVLKYSNHSLNIKLKVPYEMDNTLYGYKTLRNKNMSYFNIAINDVGSRKFKPYNLRLLYKYEGKEYENNMLLDILDDYVSNMNLYILNSYKVGKLQDLDKWLKS